MRHRSCIELSARLKTEMDTPNPIVVDVAIEPRDLNWSVLRLAYSIFWWFLLFLGILLFFEIARTPGIDFSPFSSPFTFVLLAVISIAVGVAVPRIRVFRLFRTVPGIRCSKRITVTPGGIRIESEDATGVYKWSFFYQILETERTFLLMQTPYSASYIPKRCFQTPEYIPRLRAILREHYKGKLKLRGK